MGKINENLLQEINNFDYVIEELNEDGMPKKFKLKGIYQAADTPNGNKRTYPRPVLESAVNSVQSMVTERRMLGELDHPADAKVHLDKVSHVVTELRMEPNGQVYGEAEVLPTASGKILEALLKSKVKLGISSRGFGSTKSTSTGLSEVQDDYKLVTFDIVSDPSTPGAFPQAVFENKDTNTESNSDYVTDLDEVLSESLNETVELETDIKEFICKNNDSTRFYLVESEKDSYGYLNFHISHDYHILIKNENNQERVGLNVENLKLIEDIHGKRVINKILNKVDELGYSSKTLNRKKED